MVSMSNDVLGEVEKFVMDYMKQYKDSSHDGLHVKRVRGTAIRLAKEEMLRQPDKVIDLEMVQLGAMLHDVGDFKYATEGEDSKEIIKNLLISNTYPVEKISGVLEIIDNVSYRHELAHGCSREKIRYWNEFCVVQDADRLDAIGAIGVARCFAYTGRKNVVFYVPDQKPAHHMTAEEYNEQTKNNAGSARAHFEEKLLKLVDLMKTESGREEAARRQTFMKSFLENFDQDCGLQFS